MKKLLSIAIAFTSLSTQVKSQTAEIQSNSIWIDNGEYGIRLGAPSSLSESYSFVLPSSKGNDGQILSSKGDGTTIWSSIGEYPTPGSANNIAISGVNTWHTVTSITLSAGEWDVSGTVSLTPVSLTGGSRFVAYISGSHTVDDSDLTGISSTEIFSDYASFLPAGPRRFSLSDTKIIYLHGLINATSEGSSTFGGTLRATRVR